MQEIWREHKSGLLVSNLGQVFVPKSGVRKEHYTYGSVNENGYLKVKYNYDSRLVHDLVYETFNNISTKGLHVHHKNGNTKDNRLENLIVLSIEDHQKIHAIEKSKIILQYDLNGNFIKEWSSTHEVERQLGFKQSNIVHCCRGKYKTAYGYIWKYKE